MVFRMVVLVGMTDVSTNTIFEYDELKMYFGEDYKINDKIVLKSPKLGDIIEFGEREYYSMVHTLVCIPSNMKSQLEDMKINYMEISDFELFVMLTRDLTKDKTYLLLGDLDLSKFEASINKENNELCLYNSAEDIVIDKLIYTKIVDYIRKLHNITPKVEKAYNETTRKILIQIDRERIAKAKKTPYKSQLKDLVSAMMRYPGFKYKATELKQCSLYEFMDTVRGAQIYVSTTSLLTGMYSGAVDTKKINKNEFNWLRSISD